MSIIVEAVVCRIFNAIMMKAFKRGVMKMSNHDKQMFFDLIDEKVELEIYFANLGPEIDLFEYEANMLSLNEVNAELQKYEIVRSA